MKIAIKFGDNDFFYTFYGVLTTIFEAYKLNGDIPKDKKKLAIAINRVIYGCYLLFQNQFRYDSEKDGRPCELVIKYLEVITPERILLDDEVEKYLAETKWDNSETFILDTDLDHPIFAR